MSTSNRVRLGKSDLQVSPICYGTWQLSSSFWGELPEQGFIDAIHEAYEHDINFFDTANSYADGYAETVLGKAIKTLPRDKVVIATKAYNRRYPDRPGMYGDLSSKHLREAIDESLKRLDMDYVDLYQCHSHDPLSHPRDVAQTLDDLVKAGKIRHYGVSNWPVEQMRAGAQFGNFSTCQPAYSLVNRDVERDILPYCIANDIGTLVYSSLQLGLLTGKYKGDEKFEDLRKNRPHFMGERYKTICSRMVEVGEIAKQNNMSTVQLVLTVTLMHPGITTAIVGIKNSQQITDAAGAMGKSVSTIDWNKVRSLLNVP